MTLSYHNDPAIKAFHVDQALHHYKADMLLAGTYGDDEDGKFRGCSIGCMANDIKPGSNDNLHAIVAEHAGWPEWLARLNDTIFEGLPKGERERFHVDLREAVPVGAELEPVRHRLALRRIDRLIELQNGNAGKHGDAIDAVISQTVAALTAVRRCHEAEIGGNVCDLAAESAARSAWSAARSARLAAAESARSARLAAESAAESAESAAYKQEATDLLQLLREAA